jgi:zinc protease
MQQQMKFKHISSIILLTFGFSANVFSQAQLIEKVERKGKEIIIPYSKYKLSNGLIILVHEDHSDPIVYVDVTYHVGSANEQEGRSGFAHFFEHMMFQGSEHIGDEQHFKIITEAGGTLNGSTSTDRTNYWEVLPSNQLETAFWLESDRMGFFLDSVTQRKFEVQRATVKNERGQNYDNRPYGLAFEKIDAALYPPSHPYSWQTIGYIEDLDRVNVTDLKKFFLRWYGPNNATLTVSGDVTPTEVIKLAQKYFGSIPKGPEVTPQHLAPVVLEKDRYISYEDNIRSPQINFSFPTVPTHHPDEAPLDVLADILGGNKSSIFYQNFVKTQLAQFAYVANPCEELAGNFIIMVRTFPDKNLRQMDSLVRASLAEFEKRGVTDEDLLRYKASFEANMIHSLSSVKGKGTMLAAYQTFTGNPNYIVKDAERYNSVTKQDVMRVYETYIKNKHAVVLSIYPKGKQEKASRPDNYTLPVRNVDTPEAQEYKNLVYKKANDTLNRNYKPIVPAAKPVKAPDYWTQNFENGLKIIGAESNEVPSVAIQIYIKAGHRYEKKSQAGIAELMVGLLNESTTKHSTEEMDELLEKLGSEINIDNDGNDIIVNISSLTKNIDSTLSLAEEILFHPKFDTAEFELVKNQQLESIANQSTQANVIAGNVFAKLLYGNEYIMGTSLLGTDETLKPITLEDVKKYYSEQLSPAIATAVVVGDINKKTVIPKLNFLKKWRGHVIALNTAEPSFPGTDKTKIYFVNKDKAPQSEIRIGYLAMRYDAFGEFYRSGIMNYVLGGAFNSRINLNLRELHSYTYGAKSAFSGNKFIGPFTAYAGVRANVTDSSVIEFMKEIKNYADKGITKEELSFTKNSIGQSEALKYETNAQKAGFIKRILDYNLEKNFVDKQNEILKNTTKTEIDALAKRHLPYNNFVIVVVGDKSVVFENLKKIGYDVVEVTADGIEVK